MVALTTQVVMEGSAMADSPTEVPRRDDAEERSAPEQLVVRLVDLTPAQQRLVLALIAAASPKPSDRPDPRGAVGSASVMSSRRPRGPATPSLAKP